MYYFCDNQFLIQTRQLLVCILVIFSFSGQLAAQNTSTIVVTPESATVCSGQYATFAVNETALSYRWQRWEGDDWLTVATAGRSYHANVAGLYRCVVRTDDEELFSATATLVVNNVPSIAAIHVPWVCEGGDLMSTPFGISNGGLPLEMYEWKLDGKTIEAATIDEKTDLVLHRTAVITDNGFSLTLTLYNGCGSAESPFEWVTIMRTPSLLNN